MCTTRSSKRLPFIKIISCAASRIYIVLRSQQLCCSSCVARLDSLQRAAVKWCIYSGVLMTVSLVVRHSSAGLLLQGSQLLKRDFTRSFVLRSSLLTFDDAKGRQKFVFLCNFVSRGNPDANSCSPFFMQLIFHAANFSCSSSCRWGVVFRIFLGIVLVSYGSHWSCKSRSLD